MKKIPLHCLVLMVGPSGAGKSTIASRKFDKYEIISSDALRDELFGDFSRQDINNYVFAELHRRVRLKLEVGERVVVDATNIKTSDRLALANIGKEYGLPIYYVVYNREVDEKIKTGGWRNTIPHLINKHEETFKCSERAILNGDNNIATVIDYRVEDFDVIKKLDGSDFSSQLRERGYRGVTVVGDVHGKKESLSSVIEWAITRGNFLLFLGDIVDYGSESVECVKMVYDLVVRGKAISIIGNHERKIEKWLTQRKTNEIKIRISAGNQVTVDQVNLMSESDQKKFECSFKGLINLSKNHIIIDNCLFTHGAADQKMWKIHNHRLYGRLETMALYGEVDNAKPMREDGYPNRMYNWIEEIESGKMVIVGHDVRSTGAPLVETNKNGGQAVFMDTGSAKGGHLSSADIIFQEIDLKLVNFNYY